MQPAIYSNVRNNLASLPRSISSSSLSSSTSSIRSLSPSRHTSQLRSRSSSPTPRRFASVLAYYPPPLSSSPSSTSPSTSSSTSTSVSSSPLSSNSSTIGRSVSSPLSRPNSPLSRSTSPLPLHPARPPYKELIECASLNEAHKNKTKKETESKNKDQLGGQQGNTNSITTASLSKSLDPEISSSLSISSASSTTTTTSSSLTSKPTTTTTTTYPSQSTTTTTKQELSDNNNIFLTSDEARHILDLPSLLGRDPNMIPQVLAMPIPLQATTRTRNATKPAESTAQAMTERYSIKNLNMTETEAHRMVQMMAAEIVALHEEREAMIHKLVQAKQEMLVAAKLLRAKAEMADIEVAQNMSSEAVSSSSLSSSSEMDKLQEQLRKEEEEEEKQRQTTNLYDKDEWKV
ncbi:hypothetical protein BGZ49_002575 [Haplosporangium sp. Z 27]|nr:hypothetical protein BGZ49_002575 [Haplosporangium sp. Z 27]